MKFEELAMHVPEADLDVNQAMDLLKYVSAVAALADCGSDQGTCAINTLQELTPVDMDRSCDSWKGGDSSCSASPITHGTRATEDIPYPEARLGHANFGDIVPAAPSIRQPQGMTPLMLGHSHRSFGFEDINSDVDQSCLNMQPPKGKTYPEHQLGRDIFAQEARNSTDQIAGKDNLRMEFKHADSCLSSITYALQGSRPVAPMVLLSGKLHLPEQPQVVPKLWKDAPFNYVQLIRHDRVPLQRRAPASINVKESQKQVLLVCMDSVTDMGAMKELASDFRHNKFFHFRTAVKFTRWLFEQHRGLISPWCLLVVGWRESKPCMTALEAAFSSDTGKVRPDAKRAELKKPSGGRASGRWPVRIAVATMVVLLDSPSQHERAQLWANQVGGIVPDLKIVIAMSLAEISDRFGASSHGKQEPAAFPVAGMAPQRCTDQEMQYIRLSV